MTGEHCEAHDIMVVSGSVGGGNIGTRLNACTTPQIIYEVSPDPKPCNPNTIALTLEPCVPQPTLTSQPSPIP